MFFLFNSQMHFSKMDIKNVQFSDLDLRIVKKNAKNEFRAICSKYQNFNFKVVTEKFLYNK